MFAEYVVVLVWKRDVNFKSILKSFQLYACNDVFYTLFDFMTPSDSMCSVERTNTTQAQIGRCRLVCVFVCSCFFFIPNAFTINSLVRVQHDRNGLVQHGEHDLTVNMNTMNTKPTSEKKKRKPHSVFIS